MNAKPLVAVLYTLPRLLSDDSDSDGLTDEAALSVSGVQLANKSAPAPAALAGWLGSDSVLK